jgi:hypothetical protein
MNRKLLVSVLAAIAVCAGVLMAPTPALAVGVDMNMACQVTWGAGWQAELTYPSQGAWGWRCWVPPFGVRKNVDVQKYCQQVYGLNAYAGSGAYSWYCA